MRLPFFIAPLKICLLKINKLRKDLKKVVKKIGKLFGSGVNSCINSLKKKKMTNEQKIVAFEKATGQKFDPNVTVFWLDNVSGLSELPAMPNVTVFRLFNVSGLSKLPAMPNVTDFWLDNVSGLDEYVEKIKKTFSLLKK